MSQVQNRTNDLTHFAPPLLLEKAKDKTDQEAPVEAQIVVNMRTDPYQRYIGRGQNSKWGNPFVVGRDGTRDECITKYKLWIVAGDGRHLLSRLGEIEGPTLGCFCAPKGGVTSKDPWVCHGQVLLALIEHRRMKITNREKGAS